MNWHNWRQPAAVGSGVAFSGFLLWLALRGVNGKDLTDAFSSINYIPIFLCAAALAVGTMLRAVRWRVIAGYPSEDQSYFFRATNLGAFSNLVLPGRAGEFVRVLTLARLSRSPLAGPLASALIDRLVDVFVLVCSATGLYLLFPIDAALGKWLTGLVLGGLAATLAIILYARSSGVGEVLIARIAKRWLHRWPLSPEVFLAELRKEFRRLLGSWLSIELAVVTALILCTDYAAMAALLKAFGLSLPIEAPLLLWVFLIAGSALPSAPGYIGIYQVAAVWALSLFAVSAPTAVAIATVLQITTLVVVLAMTSPEAFGILKRMRFPGNLR
jgi:uncharacterized membrane protein YbhN (UPF0104 family)